MMQETVKEVLSPKKLNLKQCKGGKAACQNGSKKDASTNAKKKGISKSPETCKPSKKVENFPQYIAKKEIDKILKSQDSENIKYVMGHLRINPRFYKHAYVSMPGDQSDLLIIGICNRNRALEGDLVVAQINPPEEWQKISPDEEQKTGFVVSILEKVHPRTMIGCLKQQGNVMVLHPRDQRVPILQICLNSIPKQVIATPQLFEDVLFVAYLCSWKKPKLPVGRIKDMIGDTGNLHAESCAILLEHNLDVTPYSEELLENLPNSDYTPTQDDIKDREDWRNKCVFTIDPDTAVDLDDAVSCETLENGNYEIGVHIADVTHYLEFLSPLDIQVAKRATTVYMTDNVYHMLPKKLCQVCSLLPGQEKLTFSVIWEMTPDTKIVKHRFAKTVIKSCCQMAYTQAQTIIENPKKKFSDDFLSIHGDFTVDNLSETVYNLHKLAVQLRKKRFANGALRIDQPKLHVSLDKSTGLPISYTIEEHKESNRLIEEFMLLANMEVATHLFNTIPETALLRNHEEPLKNILSATKITLQKFGVHIDIDSAEGLQRSISHHEAGIETESNEIKTLIKYRMMVINNLCTKAMTRATYRCSSTVETEEELRHYALNVPFYTHFTSPIRRYADCTVHRLLYSAIQNMSAPKDWTVNSCIKIATNCNQKKYSAKMAQERCNELYFTHLIDLRGPTVTVGIVLSVKENNIDVMLCQVGIKLRLYFMEIKNAVNIQYSKHGLVSAVNIFWKKPAINQVITMFTLIHLRIEKHEKLSRLVGYLLPPFERDLL